jgi:hypothetical protein
MQRGWIPHFGLLGILQFPDRAAAGFCGAYGFDTQVLGVAGVCCDGADNISALCSPLQDFLSRSKSSRFCGVVDCSMRAFNCCGCGLCSVVGIKTIYRRKTIYGIN